MAELVLYMGPSGCGKTTSLRNLPPKETLMMVPNAKSFPFPTKPGDYVKGENLIVNDELDSIQGVIQHVNDSMKQIKYVIIEDFTHCFSARIFSPAFLARNTGGEAFQRWNDFGASVFQALFAKSQEWRDDLYIIILHHTEIKEDGTIGFKSPGKLLDNTIDVPSYLTYIFHGVVEQDDSGVRYMMQTNKDSVRQAKTPYGVFPDLRIPNDMKKVLDRIELFRQGKIEIKFKD